MLQLLQLKDIASIRSGYLFRGRIEPDPAGEYQVIQIGDITSAATLATASLPRVNLPDVRPNHLVRPNDVIFISRGTRKQAVAVTQPPENCIAASQLFLLHPDKTVLPEYLAWYLNQLPAQQYIDEFATGTNVSLINMESLGKMPVPVPSLATQKQIATIYYLHQQENELLANIQAKRNLFIEKTLLKALEASGSIY